MKQSIMTVDGDHSDLMKAQQALGVLSGVLAAEVVAGQSELSIWSGDELSGNDMIGAVSACGIHSYFRET